MADEVVEVFEAFPGLRCATQLWWSQRVLDELYAHLKSTGNIAFLEKLKLYAQAGFGRYEGEGRPIRHEGKQVFRISDGGKYRIGGYYEDVSRRTTFIALDAFLKKKEKLNASERQRYADIADIRDSGRVVKKGKPDGDYPRLAEPSQ